MASSRPVVLLHRELNRIHGTVFTELVQHLDQHAIVVLPLQAVATNGAALYLRVWRPGRWIYVAAFAAATSEDAVAYAQRFPAEMAKRDPQTFDARALFAAGQAALGRFRSFERELGSLGLHAPSTARHRAAGPVTPVQSPPTPADPEITQRAAVAAYVQAMEALPLPLLDTTDDGDVLCLLALLRNNPSERLDWIAPLVAHPTPLMPRGADADSIIDRLCQRGWLRVNEASPIDAFDWDGAVPTAYYLHYVSWQLILPVSVPTARDLRELLEQRVRDKPWDGHIAGAVLIFSAWVASSECIAYLELALADHRLPFQAGEKTHAVIEKLLEHYAIGQVQNLIWRAARDAGARIRREPIAPQHAANTAIGAIERMGDRAQIENWTIRAYHRDRRIIESAMSHLILRVLLGLDDPFSVLVDEHVVRAHMAAKQPTNDSSSTLPTTQ